MAEETLAVEDARPQFLASDRRRKLLTAFGQTKTISQWAIEIGISQQLIRARLFRGQPIEIALSGEAQKPGPPRNPLNYGAPDGHCAWCGKEKFRVRRERTKYCSKDCAIIGSAKSRSRKTYYDFHCRQCKLAFRSTRCDAAFCSRKCSGERLKVWRACEQCGKRFNRRRRDNDAGRFCSRSCAMIHLRTANPLAYDQYYLGSDLHAKHRRRAKKFGCKFEVIDKLALFERDGWRCQICGCKTPRSWMGTLHPQAPEIDHRVPMSKGGGHTWANCQCACRRCNGAKGNKIISGQLQLFAAPASNGTAHERPTPQANGA